MRFSRQVVRARRGLRAAVRWGGAVALSTGLACSFATSIDRFDNRTCGLNAKACDDRCASTSDPNVGCNLPGCTPCDFRNATATCSVDRTCALGTCTGSYQNCNGTTSDGCEANVADDPMNCGQCGCRCGTTDTTDCAAGQGVQPIANGSPGCSLGMCSVGSCDPGFGDCDNDPGNGCEAQTNTDVSCGLCGKACAAPTTCRCAGQGGRTDCACDAPDAAAE